MGDYGKRGVIELALELLRDFGFERQSLWVTTFGGDPALNLPPDGQAVEEWLRQGFPPERIVPLGEDDNFWTMGGPGPCGPCTEIFVDRGVELGCGKNTCQPGCDCPRFLTAGLKRLDKLSPDKHGVVPGEDLFKLHAEQGFPSDLAVEILAERGLQVDWSGYEQALEQHREISRVSAERHFQ